MTVITETNVNGVSEGIGEKSGASTIYPLRVMKLNDWAFKMKLFKKKKSFSIKKCPCPL
jgi:hypothetical protein